jgi:ATP-dependent helicase/nuclease subunit B
MSAAAKVFTIPPTAPFVDALARGLVAEAESDPLALSRMTVLLPTRRAVRALREAFLRLSDGRPMLLPVMRPIGDIDEDELDLAEAGAGLGEGLYLPDAISSLERQLILTRLILARSEGEDRETSVAQASMLARELGHLLDQVHTERLGFDKLAELVPADFAVHWGITIEFLKVVTEHWPKILAERGLIDPTERRDKAISALARHWTEHPPTDRVIAAGSTGSIPATAELLGVIARLDSGMVVLPGLDLDLDDESWAALDPSHPQYGMRDLLGRIEVDREDVRLWPGAAEGGKSSPRVALLREAMRPAATTDKWRALTPPGQAALEGLTRLDVPGPREEAGAIALRMRQVLDTPGMTAALVTPDRQLARRVAAELGRWNVAVDDSAGTPLGDTPPGAFLRLLGEAMLERMAPVPLLALLKHPFAAAGLDRATFRATVRRLERVVLRGPRPAEGFDGLRRALPKTSDAAGLTDFIDRLETRLKDFCDAVHLQTIALGTLVERHIAAAEALAATDEQPGSKILWDGDAGEAASTFVSGLIEHADTLAPLSGESYPHLFESLMAGQVVRPRFGLHPRLSIWGPLEARLQHADLLILGGLNEGTWPPEAPSDPWMSRPMRARFGLPAHERRIGLSAHDFAQGAAAPEVVLTRARKVDGQPTVPSRWLSRLETLLGDTRLDRGSWAAWHESLDRPAKVTPTPPPAPRPPVEARPRKLSVTQVETWMSDPYALYAAKILRLRPLDPLDADPGAAERGIFIHHALDMFLNAHPRDLPKDAAERLEAYGRKAFGEALSRPSVWAFWWPRFQKVVEWFVEAERDRRRHAVTLATEVHGEKTLDDPSGPFVLTATADRIDRLLNGGLAIIDYKTGVTPTKKKREAGYAPQLPLETVLAASGSFKDVPPELVHELAYWRLTGGEPAGEITPVPPEDIDRLADQALNGLLALVANFHDPQTPYLSQPRPDYAGYGDYDHLARVKEWQGRETPS